MNITSRKLILHIGTGKAGSTSIQSALYSLKASSVGTQPIRAFGLPNAKFLAMSVRSARAHSFFVKKHKVITEDDFEDNAKTIWEKAQNEMDSSGMHRFVASSEFLCTMVRGNDIDLLRQRLEQLFDQIHIIVYLRDQRSFLRSLWAQSVKGPSKSDQSFSEFLSQIEKGRYMWDYSIFLKDWMHVFGEDNLKVTMFDPQALEGADVVHDFLQKADISAAINSPIKRQNISPSWDQLEALRLENLARNNPEAAPNIDAHEQPIDQDQYNALVLEKVSDGNHWINEKFFKGQSVKLPSTS